VVCVSSCCGCLEPVSDAVLIGQRTVCDSHTVLRVNQDQELLREDEHLCPKHVGVTMVQKEF
jgi:hypothetical protein